MSETKKFLGVGWKFPVNVDPDGLFALSEYEQSIKEAIMIILETSKGERVMRPDFGCGIHDYVFEIVNASTLGQIEHSVTDALERWEPRIELVDVSVNTESVATGKLLVNIQYVVRKTNNQFNMVYPFYLNEGVGQREIRS